MISSVKSRASVNKNNSDGNISHQNLTTSQEELKQNIDEAEEENKKYSSVVQISK